MSRHDWRIGDDHRLWQKLYPAESLPIKDSTVTRNRTVQIIVPLSDAEMLSAEVP